MYSYDPDATDYTTNERGERVPFGPRHRDYRPDLLPLITLWLASVPESEWQYFVGFRVGDRGEFIAKFMKAPTGCDYLRVVTFVVDHDYNEMHTDTGLLWDNGPARFNAADLTLAVDTL
jgi:hypothetical protein